MRGVFRQWTTSFCQKLRSISLDIPTICVWHLWKRRNNLRNWKKQSYNTLVFKVKTCIWRLLSHENYLTGKCLNVIQMGHLEAISARASMEIHETTNNEAEEIVIKKVIYHCVSIRLNEILGDALEEFYYTRRH
ncbi:hypothetical protein H5410_061771 [Solanum commersonii]|uniref:Uncharacterized protein n=1 Tax=Solanum commersonii TaxID=4109 RepID=A0A9J5W8T4_SOLCO|nr:hypothetical protein H5410_061771 [Solanum commersonii]